jgi:hypothetical protein
MSNPKETKKTLLLLLPFWTPMIPPGGIASLKVFLQGHGYEVKTADANIEKTPRALYFDYFTRLRRHIPENKRSNFYSIGHHVLRNHMTAFLHRDNEPDYIELIKLLIENIFYVDTDDPLIRDMDEIIGTYYAWEKEYLTGLLEREAPDIFGLSVYRDTLPASMFAFKQVKEMYPSIKTVMGGPIFSEQLIPGSPDMELFLAQTRPYIDKLIIGPGELLFLSYLQGNLPESQRVYTQEDINREILDFSAMGIPDYSDCDTRFYPFMGATGSNGCLFNCSFCNVLKYFGPFQKKNIRQLVREMLQLYQIYGNQLFYMTDHMVNPLIKDIAEEIQKEKIPVYWTAYLRIDPAAEQKETVLLWRKGGFYCARLGIESGSQKVLDLIGKKITIAQIKKNVSNLAAVGIKTTTYWFVGHPGETEQDFQQTLDLLEELKDDIYEAESDYFNYHYSGQVDSDKWADRRSPVFPGKYRNMLITQTWTVDCQPSREEIFSRLNRFVQHCNKIGIPNPYTLNEINQADIRWKKLHENAVPPLMDFKKSPTPLDDREKVKNFIQALTIPGDDGNFNF